MKYLRFIKNIFAKKKDDKHELEFRDDNISYEILYSNNVIDSVFEICKFYDLVPYNLSKSSIIDLVEESKSNEINSIIKFITSSDKFDYKSMLSLSSNIIVKIHIDNDNNWLRLVKTLMSLNILFSIEDSFSYIYASFTISDIIKLTKNEYIDKEICSFIKNMVYEFVDNNMRDTDTNDNYYDELCLGFDCNKMMEQNSIVDIDKSLNKCIIIGADIVTRCTDLSKVYFVTHNTSLIPGCTSTEFVNGLRYNSISLSQLLINTDEISDKLLSYIIEKYNLCDIYIIKNKSSNYYDNIDEIIY